MGEESPWEGRLSPVRFRGLMWSPGEVEADAGSKPVPAWSQDEGLEGPLLSAASPGGRGGQLQSEWWWRSRSSPVSLQDLVGPLTPSTAADGPLGKGQRR